MAQRFVIAGNGPAGVEAALALRARYEPRYASIAIVSPETDYHYSRTALMYAYMNVMQRHELEPYERGMWSTQQIELVRDAATGLDANSKRLTLARGSALDFDELLIATGSRPRTAPFAGLERASDGVVHFVSMQDLDECERLTPSTERAVVVGGGLIGIELVECLRRHHVAVTFLVREPFYWPAALTPPEAAMVTAEIERHGVEVRYGTELAAVEVDQSGRVSGVETSDGDRIACQMLGVCIGVVPATEWLDGAETELERDRGAILVDDAFRTSAPSVWAAGDCVSIEQPGGERLRETIWYAAKLHGRLAALSMLGDPVAYRPPIFYNSSKFFEIEYTTVGQVTRPPAGARALMRSDSRGRPISQLIVYLPSQEARVIGFNMLGSRWNHRILQTWIAERRPLSYVLERLREAQFDVELGRIDLSRMRETEMEITR